MSEDFKKYRNDCINNNFFNKEEVSYEDYRAVKAEDKDGYYSEFIGGGNTKYYKKTSMELSDEELAVCIQIKQLEVTEEMNQKQNTIKNILIFWLILTIIGLISITSIIIKISESTRAF